MRGENAAANTTAGHRSATSRCVECFSLLFYEVDHLLRRPRLLPLHSARCPLLSTGGGRYSCRERTPSGGWLGVVGRVITAQQHSTHLAALARHLNTTTPRHLLDSAVSSLARRLATYWRRRAGDLLTTLKFCFGHKLRLSDQGCEFQHSRSHRPPHLHDPPLPRTHLPHTLTSDRIVDDTSCAWSQSHIMADYPNAAQRRATAAPSDGHIDSDKLALDMTERFRQVLSTKRMNELTTRSSTLR